MFLINNVVVPGQSSLSCDGSRMTQLDIKPSTEDIVKKDPDSHVADGIPSGKYNFSTIKKDELYTDQRYYKNVRNGANICNDVTGVEERIANLEGHLKIVHGAPVPKDVYTRIKQLEDRVLYLEGLSPEYFTGKVSA